MRQSIGWDYGKFQKTGKFCPFLLKNLSFWRKNPLKSVRYIEVSAITKHRSAVVALLSAKSRFYAKTVSV